MRRASRVRCATRVRLTGDIRNWYKDVEQHASEGVCKILVGNKSDWADKRVRNKAESRCSQQAVSTEEAQKLAEELGMDYVETSAKSNTNVDDAFFKLAQQVKDHLVEQGITSNAPGTPGAQQLNVDGSTGSAGSKSGCC